MTKILLVNHNISKFCGVYAHGIRMYNILKESKKHKFFYSECGSLDDLSGSVSELRPDIIIYNYMAVLMGWAVEARSRFPDVIHLGMGHDVTQSLIDSGDGGGFDFRVALDPTLVEKNIWFTSVRPLFGYYKEVTPKSNKEITIGTFGFYFPHKNFESLINYCLNSVPHCKVKAHISEAHFSDSNTKNSFKEFIKQYDSLRGKVNIDITTEYLTDVQIIDFLAGNDINIFFYSSNVGAGPSSAIDYAVAAGKPILVNKSYQFRHVFGRIPTYPEYNVMSAIEAGNSEVLRLQEEWSEENFLLDYERIIDEVQNRQRR